MTLQDRINNKRKEMEAEVSKEARLWKDYQFHLGEVREQFEKPWNLSFTDKKRPESELAALETIAREMEEQK